MKEYIDLIEEIEEFILENEEEIYRDETKRHWYIKLDELKNKLKNI